MSWYLFKQSPAIQSRGKKVDGFNLMPKNKINLSWGMNEPIQSRPSSNYSHFNQINNQTDTVPATLINPSPNQNQHTGNNTKVLTDTSDDEQEELIKLIKSHREKKLEQEVMEHFNKRKKSSSIHNSEAGLVSNKEEKSPSRASRLQMDKRIRYLENHLLPSCYRNSMATILDQELSKQVPLQESRMSGKSVLHNKKNQSTLTMGDGYNHFLPHQQPKIEHLQKLKDQYQYQELCKKRMQRSNINFG